MSSSPDFSPSPPFSVLEQSLGSSPPLKQCVECGQPVLPPHAYLCEHCRAIEYALYADAESLHDDDDSPMDEDDDSTHEDEDLSSLYEIPGTDWFPGRVGCRDADGSWLESGFETVHVRGQAFTLPAFFMRRFNIWKDWQPFEDPPQPLTQVNKDPTIFAILVECLYTPSGFMGTEGRLNMVKLSLAILMAVEFSLDDEILKLWQSLNRYIAYRVFYRNPHKPDLTGLCDVNYFNHRSQEIYRTWVLCRKHAALRGLITIPRIVTLYTVTIPLEMWPALTPDFESEFTNLIDASVHESKFSAEVAFEAEWLRSLRHARCLSYPWLNPSRFTALFGPFRSVLNDNGHETRGAARQSNGSHAADTSATGAAPDADLMAQEIHQRHLLEQYLDQHLNDGSLGAFDSYQ